MSQKKVKQVKRIIKKQSNEIVLNFFSQMNNTKLKTRLVYCYKIIFKQFPKQQ